MYSHGLPLPLCSRCCFSSVFLNLRVGGFSNQVWKYWSKWHMPFTLNKQKAFCMLSERFGEDLSQVSTHEWKLGSISYSMLYLVRYWRRVKSLVSCPMKHMLVGDEELVVECFRLTSSVLSIETNVCYWKHPLFFNWVSVVELLELKSGHNWIVYKSDFTEAFDVASCSYLQGAWGLVHLEHNA